MVPGLIPSLYNVTFSKCAIVGALLLIAPITAFEGLCFLLDPDLHRQNTPVGVVLIAISAIPWIALAAWLSWRTVRFHFTNRSPVIALGSLSSLVCVGFLWARSYFDMDYIVAGSGPMRWLIVVNHGSLQVGQSRANRTPPGFQWMIVSAEDYGNTKGWFFYGVHNATGWAFGIPLWFFVLILAAAYVLIRRRRRIPSPGFCEKCDYDLRATPDQCPECGTPVPPH
jgi:hypothetical protein